MHKFYNYSKSVFIGKSLIQNLYFYSFVKKQILFDISNMIDFDLIPNEIIDSINTEFDNTEPVQGKVYDFLREKRITQLLDNIGDFSL